MAKLPRTGHIPPKNRVSTQNGVLPLFLRNTHNNSSPVFEVRGVPVLVTAFNLRPGESITIWTLYTTDEDTLEQPFLPEGKAIVLTYAANAVLLVYSGRYRAVFDGVLGELVCIAEQQKITDDSIKSRVVNQPAGAQANRPNALLSDLSTSNESPILDVIDVPYVITLFTEEVGERVRVDAVYSESGFLVSDEFVYDNKTLLLDSTSNTVLLDKSGRYRFTYTGTIGAATLVAVPLAVGDTPRQSISVTYDEIIEALGYVPLSAANIESLQAEIDAVEIEVAQLAIDVDAAEAQVAQLALDVDAAEAQVAQLALDVDAVEAQVSVIQGEVDAVESDLAALAGVVAGKEDIGVAADLMAAHVAAPNPHPQYLLTVAYTAADVLAKLLTVDGSGSGLDADLLDGQHGAYYADIPARLGYTPLDAASYTAADVLTKLLTVDGSGSNLDADLLDGQHGAYYADIPARLGYTPLNASAVSAFMLTVLDDTSAGAALTTLGGTTVGQAFFNLTNPGVVSFIRVNTDNTVTARTLAQVKVDLNYQASEITVDDSGWSTLGGPAIQNALNDADTALGNLDTEINGKEPAIPLGTTGQFWRGDKAWTNTVIGPIVVTDDITAGGIAGEAGTHSLNIYQPTIDGADTARVAIVGGATQNTNRGAYIQVYGNEYAGATGVLRLVSGSAGNIQLLSNGDITADSRVFVIPGGVAITPAPASIGVFQRSNGTSTPAAISVVSGNASTATINLGDADDEDVCFIRYNNSTEELSFAINATANILRLSTTQLLLPSTMADGTNTTAAASTAYAVKAAPNSSYRNLYHQAASHTAAQATGKYAIGWGNPAPASGVGTLYAWGVFYFDPADYPTINALTTKLRIRAQVTVNDTAPGASFTIGLYPVTHTGATGGAGLNLFTLGTVITGSTVAINTPAADSTNQGNSGDFAISLVTAGWYCIGFEQTGAAIAANSHLFIAAQLQMRNT